ncbi:MAG: hypothetical protein ACHQKY_16440 [Terriglobia bacterium]
MHILSAAQNVAYLSVVHRTPPGNYSGAEGGAIKIRNDSISYEAIEAGSIAYYFINGRYHALQTSE